MKKLFLLLSAAAATLTAAAEGYQVNNLSSRQNGMGHVGTAMKLNSESLWFNPAAAAFQEKKFDISAGITGIATKGTYTSLPDYAHPGETTKFTSDNKISTPLYLYANYKPAEWMSAGLVFNTPFGSTMNWGDNWVGAHVSQNINLAAYNLQPTLSFRIGKHLSAGAGLMMVWGNFDLAQSLLPVGAATNTMLDGMLYRMTGMTGVFARAGDRSLASLALEGDSKLAVGVNLGLMYDINPEWTLGFSYRSQLNMKVDSGDVALNFIDDTTIAATIRQVMSSATQNPQLAPLGMLAQLPSCKLRTELPLPASLTWGVSFRPVPKWEFAVDLQYVLWSAYDELSIDFVAPDGQVLHHLDNPKNYSNTLAFRFGGQYHALRWLTVRMGMYVDESPVSSDWLNPETPSMTKLAYTAGFTLRPARCCAFDFAYGFVNSADPERTGSTRYTNLLTQEVSAFGGNYKARAHTFSFGMRFNF